MKRTITTYFRSSSPSSKDSKEIQAIQKKKKEAEK